MRRPMSLTPGTRLGPYEVVAEIGKGGMGEVYRARDTRLDRDGAAAPRRRIAPGPVPVHEALPLAKQSRAQAAG